MLLLPVLLPVLGGLVLGFPLFGELLGLVVLGLVVSGLVLLGLMVGISVNDTTQGTAVANLGWDEVRFPAPIFVGDTLRIETEVLEVRESKSRPHQGIVTFAHRAYNQNGELVAHCKRASLQRKRPA